MTPYQCPKCLGKNLIIQATVWLSVGADGRGFPVLKPFEGDVPVWDSGSVMECQLCGYSSEADEFDPERSPPGEFGEPEGGHTGIFVDDD